MKSFIGGLHAFTIIKSCGPIGTVHGCREQSKCQQFRNVMNDYHGSKFDCSFII
jgi:hypothetical protein